MDGSKFDELTRRFVVSRRGALRLLAGSVLGAAAPMMARTTGSAQGGRIPVCHATGSGSNPWTYVEISDNRNDPHSGHAGDIIAVDLSSNPNHCGACGHSCDDGDPCTIDTCVGGACVNTLIDCSGSSDQCNTGVCNGGQCVKQPVADGTNCSDGNLCTQTDTCQAGNCTGSNPVVCSAIDECHDVGVCDPGSGFCTNPPKPDGTRCGNTDACDGVETCRSGSCTPGTAVVCQPLSECHEAGVCNPSNGACTNPPKLPGSLCGNSPYCDDAGEHAQDRCDGVGRCIPGAVTPCGSSERCEGTTCVSTCRNSQESCDPGANECCNGLCREVTRCGDGPQCCVTAPTQCNNSCDCCDPFSCVHGVCCGNLQGLECDDEQHICCAGFQCLNGTCQLNNCPHTGESCTPENNECCQDEPTDCRIRSCGAGSATVPRCCHPSGGSCNVDCDCCPGLECTGRGVCEVPVPPPTCGATGFGCVGDTGICCGDNAVCVGIPGYWQCAGNEGEPCRAVGTFQEGFPGGVYSDVAVDCNIWGGYTCGPDLVCIVCGQSGDSCVNAASSTAGSTCCLGGAGCVNGVCG